MDFSSKTMVGVAQLAEHWVVAPVAEGSSPFIHPIVNLKGQPASADLFLWDKNWKQRRAEKQMPCRS